LAKTQGDNNSLLDKIYRLIGQIWTKLKNLCIKKESKQEELPEADASNAEMLSDENVVGEGIIQ
jgi:hypothetical protein